MRQRLKKPWVIVAAIVAAFAVVIGRGYYRSRARDALVRDLKERGVGVRRDYVGPRLLERFWPEDMGWLRRQGIQELELGDDELLARVAEYLPYVRAAFAGEDSVVTDASLRHIGRLNDLQSLGLSQTQVTDTGLRHVGRLKSLHILDLSKTKVTDAGLKYVTVLSGARQLRVERPGQRGPIPDEVILNLSQTQVTDAGLRRLADIDNLYALDLSKTQVTDAGLKHIAGLRKIHTLDLSQTQVTDAGLQHLASFKALWLLDLSRTQVADAGLEHLGGLQGLNRLDLTQTQVTDAGIRHLAELKGLMVLELSQTLVTDAGLQQIPGLLARGGALKLIGLWQTQATEAGVAALRQTVPGLIVETVPHGERDPWNIGGYLY